MTYHRMAAASTNRQANETGPPEISRVLARVSQPLPLPPSSGRGLESLEEKMLHYKRSVVASSMHRHDWIQDRRSEDPGYDCVTSESWQHWREAWSALDDTQIAMYAEQADIGNRLRVHAASAGPASSSALVPRPQNDLQIVEATLAHEPRCVRLNALTASVDSLVAFAANGTIGDVATTRRLDPKFLQISYLTRDRTKAADRLRLQLQPLLDKCSMSPQQGVRKATKEFAARSQRLPAKAALSPDIVYPRAPTALDAQSESTTRTSVALHGALMKEFARLAKLRCKPKEIIGHDMYLALAVQ